MNEKVLDLVKEIRGGSDTAKPSSQKDELRVMQAMLNDRDFKADVWGKNGVEGQVCPAQEARDMISSVMSSAANIPSAEAVKLAAEHDFSKSEAKNMLVVGKEFVNTYLGTGRKLPFGGREKSDIAITQKVVADSTRYFPKQVGVNEDGTAKYERVPVEVNAHISAKVTAPCPAWIK